MYTVLRETSEQASAVHRQPLERQKQFWTDRFQGAGWQSARFLDGMHTTQNFYSQEMVQVRANTWSKGRVVLVGDAAHCPSPYSGMGTSGGLVGAYVLADEINRSPSDLSRALSAYEAVLRPFANQIQRAVKPGLLRLIMPSTPLGIKTLRSAAALAVRLRIPGLAARYLPEHLGGAWQLPTMPHQGAT